MIRLFVILSFASALLFAGISCSSSMRTPEGQKYKPLSKFSFRFNNKRISNPSEYKRYVAYNKKQQAKSRKQLAKKSVQQKAAAAKKDLLAVE